MFCECKPPTLYKKLCLKDTVENHSKTQVWKKNQNLHLKKRGNLKEKSQKSLTNLNKYQLFKPVMHFFNVFKSI